MKNLILNWSLNYPKRVFIAVALVVFGLGAAAPMIQIDTDPENMLPVDNFDRVNHNKIKDKFNIYDLIAIGIVNNKSTDGIYNSATLSKIHKLNSGIEKIDGVIRHEMMSIPSSDNVYNEGEGTIRFEWLMKSPPQNQKEASAIKEAVERLPLAENTIVSGDHKAAAIYVPVVAKSESYRISKEIDVLIEALGVDDNGDEFYYTGIPVAQDTFGVEMFEEMAIAVPVTSVLILFVMWLFFRSASLVNAPMLMAHGVVIATMGLLIATGNTVAIMSSLIPIFLLPIAIVDSVHILSEFCDRYKPGDNVRKVLTRTVNELFRPMLFTSLTTAVGFSSLVFAPIPPVQTFGIFVAFGIILAFLFTITFIPAYIIKMKPEKLEKMATTLANRKEGGFISRALQGFGKWTVAAPKTVLMLTIGIIAISVFGITKIEINDSAVNQFAPDHKMRIADKVLNEHFSGTNNSYLVLNKHSSPAEESSYWKNAASIVSGFGDETKATWDKIVSQSKSETFNDTLNNVLVEVNDLANSGQASASTWLQVAELTESAISQSNYFTQPEALAYLDHLQRGLANSGTVGKVNGLPDLVKTVNRELRGGSDEQFQIPETQQGIAQVIMSFQGSHRPHDLWHMVTPDYRSAMLWMQLPDGANMEMEKVHAYVNAFIAENPLPQGVGLEWGGLTHLYVIWQHAMVDGMLGSLMMAYIVVFFLMMILFRSVVFSLLALIPLTLTILFIYGIIGIVGKSYDTPIAILSSLVLGLTVDYSIHFLDRARALFNETGDWKVAIAMMFKEPARAITRNAIVIAVGFSPLVFSLLTPYITVGKFLAAVMIISCVITLLIFPVILTQLPSKLLSRNTDVGAVPELEGEQP